MIRHEVDGYASHLAPAMLLIHMTIITRHKTYYAAMMPPCCLRHAVVFIAVCHADAASCRCRYAFLLLRLTLLRCRFIIYLLIAITIYYL